MQDETRKRLALNLRMLRVNRGLTQYELAEMAGSGRELYAQYEKANRNPDAEFLFNLSKLAGIRMEIFFEVEPDKFMSEATYRKSVMMETGSFWKLQKAHAVFQRQAFGKGCCPAEEDEENEQQLKAFQDRFSK